MIKHIDDPGITVLSDTAGTGITWATSNDSGTSPVRAVAAGKGIHYAGATSASATSMTELCSNDLIFTGQEGHSSMEVLLQLDVVTNVAFNFGFNDDVNDTSNTLPVELSGTTWTSNAATFLGFAFDTDADNDELHCFWVDDDVDCAATSATLVNGKSLRMTGMAPTAAKWLYMKVEMQDRGSGNGVRATFLAVDHNGRSVEKVFNTTVDRDCPLCYYLGVECRGTAAKNIYIKCPNWEQAIANM